MYILQINIDKCVYVFMYLQLHPHSNRYVAKVVVKQNYYYKFVAVNHL